MDQIGIKGDGDTMGKVRWENIVICKLAGLVMCYFLMSVYELKMG